MTTRTAAPAVVVRTRAGAVRLPLAGWLALLTAALVASVAAAVSLGPVAIPLGVVWRVIGHELGLADGTGIIGPDRAIVWGIRLPRVLLGAVTGAGLALVGAVLQAVLRNPLADPYLIGVTSGASLGAVSVMLLGLAPLAVVSVPAGAFAGAVAAFAVVLALGRASTVRLILAGVAVAALCEAVTQYVVLTTPDRDVRSALHWTLGGLAGTEWGHLPVAAAVTGAAGIWFVTHITRLNALTLGDDTAASLGVDGDRVRRQLIVGCALVTASLVSVTGGIGFVALIVPHTMRLLVGPDHRRLLPVAALAGAVFLVWVDLAARTVNDPDEVPISVITALLGAPFFLYLLRKASP
ncbi:iron ABC transporter permease [Micromonospora sp. KC721]|uniref:FecCD family ABC transporter permease n=1 Tax=Micromonospora sp. KC721 TaxID=2530380 RepID=UPI001051259F|nr:iron ABC transporter permease [Micromonospora sp. KC721]TDB73101.1 iron ABC transporter permease [Micromonospora sp. KC721]